jgi:murein DD-endopeptidase MepM/ murein hydrolase activator NlpD
MAKKPRFSLLGLLILMSLIHPYPAYPAARPVDARSDTDADRAAFIWPVRGSVTSGFGSRRVWGRHRGVDIKAPRGTPIRAVASGTVVFSGRQSSYGRVVKIAHRNGLSTVYAHNSANFVKAGDQVKAGTLIGTVGHSGRATTDHVHFEVRSDGVAKNPLPLLQRPQPGPMVAKPHGAMAPAHHRPSSEIAGKRQSS